MGSSKSLFEQARHLGVFLKEFPLNNDGSQLLQNKKLTAAKNKVGTHSARRRTDYYKRSFKRLTLYCNFLAVVEKMNSKPKILKQVEYESARRVKVCFVI